MTGLIVWLTVVVLLGSLIAGTVARRLRRRIPSDARLDTEIARACLTARERFRPMERLLADEDFAFLGAQRRLRPEGIRRFRRARWTILGLYLRDLRLDFQRAHTVCRILATKSRDAAFAALINRQAAIFYSLLLVVYIRWFLGWFQPIRISAGDLAAPLDRLGTAIRETQVALAGAPPNPAG